MPPLSAQHAPTVLCIDDQEDGLAIRKLFLETFGYRVLTASSGADGLRLAAEHAVHVVLLDYRMPEMDGEEVARRLRGQHPALPILMLTGFAQELPTVVHTLEQLGPLLQKLCCGVTAPDGRQNVSSGPAA